MNNSIPSNLTHQKHLEIPNAGSWSFEENLSYTLFVDIQKKSLTSKKKMR